MKKQTAQIALRITLAAVTVVLAALLLVTCDLIFPPNGSEDGEYTDVIYSSDGRLLTVYLRPDGMGDDVKPGPDTYGVPRTAEQRALSLELAKMSHDYFEAVFVNGTTIARATWEIGMPAGISGVGRGADYTPITGTTASIIFVGKKTGKTLLGIGQLVKVDNTIVPASGTMPQILAGTKSVTFGVYPLQTGVGFINTATGGPPAPPPNWALRPLKTFLQNYGSGTISDTVTLANGQNIALQLGAEYPLYKLPEVGEPPVAKTILASYSIGGIDDAATNTGLTNAGVVAVKPNFFSACILADKLEIIKRTPSFLYKGQIFDAVGEVIDMVTTVTPTNNQSFASATPETFTNPIEMTIQQTNQSTGLFAITFQVPVYAITPNPVSDGVAPNPPTVGEPMTSSNGGPPATKWYIRPGYNQYQYLLDDGESAGGAVMLGSGVSGLDWLDIFTVGIGFSN